MTRVLRQSLSCLAWILLSMCAGLAALFWPVNAWYAELAKPSWNPPNWLFGPVWTTLYILIGVSAWRVAVRTLDQIRSGSCSTRPGSGKCCGSSQ